MLDSYNQPWFDAQDFSGPVVAGRDLLRRLTRQQVLIQPWEGDILGPRYFRLMDPDMPVRFGCHPSVQHEQLYQRTARLSVDTDPDTSLPKCIYVCCMQICMAALGPVEEDELDLYVLQHGAAPLMAVHRPDDAFVSISSLTQSAFLS